MVFWNKLALSLGRVRYLVGARVSKATRGREEFLMVHLVLVSGLLVCVCKYFQLLQELLLSMATSVYVRVYMYILETACKDKMLFPLK